MNSQDVIEVLTANPEAQGIIVKSLVDTQVVLSTMTPVIPAGWQVELLTTVYALKRRCPDLVKIPRWTFTKV